MTHRKLSLEEQAEREARLPKWVREELQFLRREISTLHTHLTAREDVVDINSPDAFGVAYDSLAAHEGRPLWKLPFECAAWYFGSWDRCITVKGKVDPHGKRYIEAHGFNGLLVQPVSTNVVSLYEREKTGSHEVPG